MKVWKLRLKVVLKKQVLGFFIAYLKMSAINSSTVIFRKTEFGKI